MALGAVASEYFRSMNPLAAKIHEDIEEAKNAYENIWDTLTEKEKAEIINESIIKPEIALKYALLDTLDFDLNDPPVRKDDLMSFFGRDHGQKLVHDENGSYRDEHSAPFLYQTKSQLNLCVLSEHRLPKDANPSSPQPVMYELALSHSKVVNELKNALKSHDVRKSTFKEVQEREPTSPSGFISKFIGNFKSKDEERECLVTTGPQTQIVASSDNYFRTNFKSPHADSKFEKDYRNSVAKSSSDMELTPPMWSPLSDVRYYTSDEERGQFGSASSLPESTLQGGVQIPSEESDLSEENRGLLSSQASSTDFQSTETLTDSTVPKTGYDFLDNW